MLITLIAQQTQKDDLKEVQINMQELEDRLLKEEIQDHIDEYCYTLGLIDLNDNSVIEFDVNNKYFQLILHNTEKIENEFRRFDFLEDLTNGRRFKRSTEGLNEMMKVYQEFWKELSFYSQFDSLDLLPFVTK